MDKKSGRSVQPLTKGANFEKKTQDNNGKLWTKGGNRREAACGSLSVKPDVVRKNVPRSRASDKRPRPRGQQDAVVRDEAPSLENQPSEEVSVNPSSRNERVRVMNHLTNFSFAPRNRVQRVNGNRSSHQIGNYSVKAIKNMNGQFLQANCQFVVNTSGDYRQHLNNPDALVDWNYIEQININVNDPPLCPICHYPPSAAKITRCGHIYCWACFLHYLDISEVSFQKCPICFQNVYEGDLKSVAIISHSTFNIGDTITFKLMKRNMNSMTPIPVDEAMQAETSLKNFSEDEASKKYCKLILAQNSDICKIIEREQREIEDQLLNAEASEICFIEKAAVNNQERQSKILEDMLSGVELGQNTTSPFESKREGFNHSQDSPETSSNSKYIYFYQASDGQHIYIHSFNVKMLKHTYGSLEYAPTTITAKILSKESDYMIEEYRKRFKYLAHLPVTCPFETMEIELNYPVVTEDTLHFFAAELEEREKARLSKAMEEKICERRIIAEQNLKIYGIRPDADISLESMEQFPSIGSPTAGSSDFREQNRELNEPSCSTQDHSSPLSFAKMAASVKAQSNPWPQLRSSAIPIVSPGNKELVTGSDHSGRRRYNSNCTTTSEDDLELVPQARTFEEALAQCFQNASKMEISSGNGKKSKKGKRKKFVNL